MTNITSMTESAEEERRARMRQYLLTMAFRTVCVLALMFVRGPAIWFVAASAIFLPWIAVMLANHMKQRRVRHVDRPDAGVVDVVRPTVTADDWVRAAAARDAGREREERSA
ncbi:MAG: DUF3099 domain-containing protein [Microbacteriaceae bacterium]|nr:DUF3099 domain-containing protein [Microbacteriaceae bacterium]